MDNKALKEAGIVGPAKDRVLKMARLAKSCGVDGVVASAQEARAIRKSCGREFLIVTPGVRPADKFLGKHAVSKKHDQSRTATPTEAIKAGADFMVVGRPILDSPDPRAAAQEIVDEIAAAK
jgi:orotidine-5'-phosphate decarboxylase